MQTVFYVISNTINSKYERLKVVSTIVFSRFIYKLPAKNLYMFIFFSLFKCILYLLKVVYILKLLDPIKIQGSLKSFINININTLK